MPDELESLLRLVAEGRLTPDEAAPLLAALQDRAGAKRATADENGGAGTTGDARGSGGAGTASGFGPDRGSRGRDRGAGLGRPSVQDLLANRRIRIFVAENGRQIVNLQVPLGAAGFALDRLPGLSDDNRERIADAIRSGMTGPILEVNDEGDQVRIVIE